VRHIPAKSSSWYAATDDLVGTAAPIGNQYDNSSEWNIKFDTLSFDKYLFVNDSFKYWAILSKKNLLSCIGTFEKSSNKSAKDLGKL
jgi:hypothetical protein